MFINKTRINNSTRMLIYAISSFGNIILLKCRFINLFNL